MLKEFIPVNHNPGNVHISPSVSNEDNSQKDGAFREEWRAPEMVNTQYITYLLINLLKRQLTI